MLFLQRKGSVAAIFCVAGFILFVFFQIVHAESNTSGNSAAAVNSDGTLLNVPSDPAAGGPGSASDPNNYNYDDGGTTGGTPITSVPSNNSQNTQLSPGGSANTQLSPGGSANTQLSPGGSANTNPNSGGGTGSKCSGPGCLANPLKFGTISGFLLGVIDVLLIFAVPVIIFFIIYAGFLFVTAQGDTTKISTARSALTWAVIGGVIALGAKIIVSVIENTVNQFQ